MIEEHNKGTVIITFTYEDIFKKSRVHRVSVIDNFRHYKYLASILEFFRMQPDKSSRGFYFWPDDDYNADYVTEMVNRIFLCLLDHALESNGFNEDRSDFNRKKPQIALFSARPEWWCSEHTYYLPKAINKARSGKKSFNFCVRKLLDEYGYKDKIALKIEVEKPSYWQQWR
jgi:hypothetical protein